jgi:TPR repeat protein
LCIGLHVGAVGMAASWSANAQGLLTAEERNRPASSQARQFLPAHMEERADELKLSPLARQALGVEWALSPNQPSFARGLQQRVLEAAAQAGDPRAAYALAGLAKGDAGQAFRWTLVAAQAGWPEAQFHVAHMLLTGFGAPKSPELALEWLFLAARGGHAGARKAAQEGKIPWQTAGPTIESLQSLGRDEAAYKAWREFALTGHPVAAYHTGQLLFRGHGVAVDKVEAVRWIGRAATHAYAPALYVLGQAYATGDGTSRNVEEGVIWLTIARTKASADLRKTIDGDLQRFGAQVSPEAKVALSVLSPAQEPQQSQAEHDRKLLEVNR